MKVLDQARRVADAVLYEGYLLYPYRASARKNHVRWQFGVLAPRRWCEAGGCESSWQQTDILVELGAQTRLTGKVRGLQLSRRAIEALVDGDYRPVETLEVDGRIWTSWDEGLDRELDFEIEVIPGLERVVRFKHDGHHELEALRDAAGVTVGRVVRERWPVVGEVKIAVSSVGGVSTLARLEIRVDNLTTIPAPGASRDEALRGSWVSVHTLLALDDGQFVSPSDMPDWARAAAGDLANVRTWPVLLGPEGERGLVLSSPIILADHPQVAPESPGDLYDATEIDEILTLRTMTLTDAEKREARATDARAAAIIDRVEGLPPEQLARLHGAIRSMDAVPQAPFWDPGVDSEVSPDTDRIEVGGEAVGKGSRVRLVPGRRRTDAQDMFLVGRAALVQGVYFDVDGRRYLAVTLEDDPGADLHVQHGRFLYFYPDEVEPLGDAEVR